MKKSGNTFNRKAGKTFVFSLSLLIFICSAAFAQDIHFSQFDETPLQLNPANAAVHHDVRVITNYRNQWQAVGSPYKTFAASTEFRFLKDKKNHLGLGVDFFNDKAGDAQMASTQANVSLSGIVPLSLKSLVSGGLMCGFSQRSMKFDNLTWGNQFNGMSYDANLATGEPGTGTSFTFLDLGAGVQFSYGTDEMYISANNARKVNIGFSVFHPHRPVYSFYGNNSQNLQMKMVFHGDAALGLKNTPLILKPSYIVFLQGGTKEITPGLTIQYILREGSIYTKNKNPAAFSLGGYYRTMDAFIATAKLEFSNYAIGFSYDVNLSKLRTVTSTRGGFEISLRFISPGAFGNSRARI